MAKRTKPTIATTPATPTAQGHYLQAVNAAIASVPTTSGAGTTSPAAMVAQMKLHWLTLENARSWKGRSHLELHPGLNVLVGASDCGKSNIVRSVLSVIHNDSAEAVVNSGCTAGSVSLQFNDQTVVQLCKGRGKDKTNQYHAQHMGGPITPYTSIGSSVPPAVRSALGMGPYDFGGDEVDVHVATQRGGAFGVDHTPSQLARIIGAVSGIDRLYRALAAAETSRRDTASTAKVHYAQFQKDVAAYRDRRKAQDRVGLPAATAALEAKLVALDQWGQQATQAGSTATLLEQSLQRHATAQRQHDVLGRALTALQAKLAGAEQARTGATQAQQALTALIQADYDRQHAVEAADANDRQLVAARAAVAELQAQLAETGTQCPTCGQETTALNLIEHTHG